MEQFAAILATPKHNAFNGSPSKVTWCRRNRGMAALRKAESALHRSWDISDTIHVRTSAVLWFSVVIKVYNCA